MKKFKLSLDQLKVDSFETHNSKNSKGTVVGLDQGPNTYFPQCPETDPIQDTCNWKCDETQQDSCLATCIGNTCPYPCGITETCPPLTKDPTCNDIECR